jgi:5-methylcytosine-specific restriction endonuclease McrBC GTP-binding regulatory subunit McrB
MEDDKRLGADEALKAILPYSKENFGVPCNLHIIGTMNTADRSVEALDTALRRRFAFINLQPEPDKLTTTDDGINLAEMLSVINNRLSILKDADHTIGHAWLWNVKNIEQLKGVFRVNILPLLKEYFYNDYEKLGLVLGDSFFEPHVQVNGNVFADFSGGNGLAMQYDQSWQFQLKPAEELTISDFNTLTPLTNRTLPDEEQ